MNAIYVRVSTDEQAKKGYSLDDQRQSCRNKLISLGLFEIQEYTDDGYSGEFLERPGLEKLRNNLAAGLIKNICIYDPDRLSRNLTNQLILADEIEKSNCQLYFVTGDYDASPEGRLFFSMKGAVAAYEKAKIRERTIRGKRGKANKGKIVINCHPFGFDWDKDNSMYIINEREAEIVKLIYDMYLTHKWGARTIALELARLGFTGRKNRPLSLSTINRILSKEMYCGIHHLFKQSVRKTGQNTREIKNNPQETWIPIEIPAIVDRTTWQKAQKQMQLNKKLAKRNTKRDYLLRGLLYCALCGRSMTAYARPGRRKNSTGKIYHYYSCISKESNSYALSGQRCNCRRIPVEELENEVWQTLTDIARGEKNLADYLREQNTPDYSAEIAHFSHKQADLKKKKADITQWYTNDLIDSETAAKELRTIDKEVTATISTLASLTIAQEKIKQPNVSPADILNAKTFAEKRDIMLQFPYQIHVVRLGDTFEFWFKK